METGAAPAREWLAPLAVLIPILMTVVVGVWSLSDSPRLLVLVIPGGLALTAWAGELTYGITTSVLAGFFTLVACLPAFMIVLWAAFGVGLCTKEIHGSWNVLMFAGGALVFFVIGTFAFRTGFAPVLVPVGFLAGVLTIVAVAYVVPGTPVYCD